MEPECTSVAPGGIAQLVEHLHGMQGVRSSSLLASTTESRGVRRVIAAAGAVEESPGFTGQGAG